MKKYWWAWVLLVLIGGAICWAFLGEVEENGRAYVLVGALKVVLYLVCVIVFLAFNIFYFSDKAIPKKLDSWLKKQNKVVDYAFFGLWIAIYLCVVMTGYKFVSWCSDGLENYQFQKKFDHKYKVDL